MLVIDHVTPAAHRLRLGIAAHVPAAPAAGEERPAGDLRRRRSGAQRAALPPPAAAGGRGALPATRGVARLPPQQARWALPRGAVVEARSGRAPHRGVVKAGAPRARRIFDTVDLHFVREQREARLTDDAAALAEVERRQREELALIRRATSR